MPTSKGPDRGPNKHFMDSQTFSELRSNHLSVPEGAQGSPEAPSNLSCCRNLHHVSLFWWPYAFGDKTTKFGGSKIVLHLDGAEVLLGWDALLGWLAGYKVQRRRATGCPTRGTGLGHFWWPLSCQHNLHINMTEHHSRSHLYNINYQILSLSDSKCSKDILEVSAINIHHETPMFYANFPFPLRRWHS